MKNKIAFKLILLFSSTLLLLSAIIGLVFSSLFRTHTIQMHQFEMEKRAVSIASTLSSLFSGSGAASLGNRGSYGLYMRHLYDIAGMDVWIVDENLQLVTIGRMGNQQFQYADLPANAEEVVKEVFQGSTTFSEGFSTLLNTPTLTVGTPIFFRDQVIGAVLLHSPVEGMNQAIEKGFGLLTTSMVIALILAVCLSVLLALAFTKPLKIMKSSTIRLAAGDYTVKTGVSQKDEIGDLAAAIDVLSERLYLAGRESEQLQKLRRDFVANISHELRTPVTVIRGSLEALNDGVVTDPEQIHSYYRQMLNESLFLQRLVNDLLDLSRLQNTDFQMEMQDLSLNDILSDVVRSIGQIAQEAGVKILLQQQKNRQTVFGDYGRLRQMFLIILDNAVKFSKAGGIVTVSVFDKTASIKDDGVGISEEDLPYIFDRFYKVESEQNKTGTGLGLSIAKQIADRHLIQISVRSRINEGTVFHFQFPDHVSSLPK